jgi:ribosomal protein S18 acetylase RimI-like enzyme
MLPAMSLRPPNAAAGASLVKLRDGTPEDAEAIEAVHYSSREAVYKDRTSDWPPPGLDRAGRIARWKRWLSDPDIVSIVAVQDGQLAGFCTIRPSADADADPALIAEMPTLYVRPESWGHGLGKALCDEAIARLIEIGFRELTLWVLDMNTQATGFYEAFGFAADGASKVDEATSESLVAHRYRIALGAA